MSAPLTRDRHTPLGLLAALVVLAADQASKYWMLHVLDLPALRPGRAAAGARPDHGVEPRRHLRPAGRLRGVEQRGRWACSPSCVVAALGVWLRRAESRLVAAALGAIAGGAVGNVIDRVRFGAVVDFIHAHVGAWSWHVFNVADAAIVCGVAALVIGSQWGRAQRRGRRRPPRRGRRGPSDDGMTGLRNRRARR